MELNKQLGQGGAGMHTTAPGSAAEALKALFGLRVSLVTGGAANAKLALADIRPGDTILAAHNNNSGAFTDVTASTTIDNPNATGTVTVGAATAGDSVTIAGLTYTLVAPGTAIDAGDMTKLALVGGQTAAVLAGRLAALVNAREDNRTSPRGSSSRPATPSTPKFWLTKTRARAPPSARPFPRFRGTCWHTYCPTIPISWRLLAPTNSKSWTSPKRKRPYSSGRRT